MMIILYIAGAGRSGSTLLEMILGNVPSFFSIGEARYFWEYLQEDNIRCGCGELLKGCHFWEHVIETVERGYGVNTRQAATLAAQINRTRNTLLLNPNFSLSPLKRKSVELTRHIQHLYWAIWEESGQKVIVDSSKVPSQLSLLSGIPEIDLRVLHLIRDGRAVAYSWSKRQKQELARVDSTSHMPYRSPIRAALVWMAENSFTERLGQQVSHYTVLKYENFTRNPHQELAQSLKRLGFSVELNHLKQIDRIQLSPTHSVGGNPLRFVNKAHSITIDEEWQWQMSPLTKFAITCFTAPLLLRFGYRLQA